MRMCWRGSFGALALLLKLLLALSCAELVLSGTPHKVITSIRIPRDVQRGKELVSEVLEWEGGEYRLALYPRGSDSSPEGYSSVYLDRLGGKSPCDVVFSIALLSAVDEEEVDKKYCSGHSFSQCSRQGFREFVEEEYFSESALECLKEDGSVSLALSLRNPQHVQPSGIFNLGNTCYMNSLLQSMFNAESFRKAVILECEKEGMAGKPTLLSSLQSLFENMSKGQGHTASTRPLASLLGLDPRIQQDAQEFGRLFFMELESEARGQGWAGVVQAVEGTFKGTMENYIECVDVPAKRVWEEPFYDLSVDVRGHSRLEGSLDSFMEPEMLKGDNQWKTEEYGRQDARKGMRMVSLPPVLQFHFKRFAYDASTGGMRKINDRFEFPTVLDMRKWVTGNQLDTSSTTYALRAIVMHQGGPDRGHYYAYVRPSGETNNWFEVNDTVVKPVTEAHVLSNAFGGHGRGLLGRMAQLFSPGHSDSSSSAYMVQYSCTTSVPGSKTLQESQEEVLVDGPLREQ